MTDKIDTLLREHGESWRAANQHRPAIDWDEITTTSRSRRGWVFGSAVIAGVAAVAVIVALVATRGGSAGPGHRQLSPAAAERGAPAGYFAITPPLDLAGNSGAIAYVTPGEGSQAFRPADLRAVAIGVAPSGSRAYAAFPDGSCRTAIHANSTGPYGFGNRIMTVPVAADRQPMAVSPDGHLIALVATKASVGGACRAGSRVWVINRASHALTWWSVPKHEVLSDLAWSDPMHLSVRVGPDCSARSDVRCPPGDAETPVDFGTHLIDVTAVGHNVDDSPVILTPIGDPNSSDPQPVVLTWRGRLAVITGGTLRYLNGNGGLGAVAERGFPSHVYLASSDRSGNHILMVGDPLHGYVLTTGRNQAFNADGFENDDRVVTAGQLFRWDRGRLTKVSGEWVQPAW
jgi:hypothetical protein